MHVMGAYLLPNSHASCLVCVARCPCHTFTAALTLQSSTPAKPTYLDGLALLHPFLQVLPYSISLHLGSHSYRLQLGVTIRCLKRCEADLQCMQPHTQDKVSGLTQHVGR